MFCFRSALSDHISFHVEAQVNFSACAAQHLIKPNQHEHLSSISFGSPAIQPIELINGSEMAANAMHDTRQDADSYHCIEVMAPERRRRRRWIGEENARIVEQRFSESCEHCTRSLAQSHCQRKAEIGRQLGANPSASQSRGAGISGTQKPRKRKQSQL